MRPNSRVLLVICTLLSACMSLPCISAYRVGVRAGDWCRYGVSDFHWESTHPNATIPPEMEGGGPLDWVRLEVVEVSGTSVTVEMTMRFKNGTEESARTGGDVGTGMGNLTFFLFPAGLSKGEALPAGAIVNDTVARTYAGVVREVNLLSYSFSMPGMSMSYEIYFDRGTGIMCEMSFASVVSDGEYVTSSSVTERLMATNMFGRADIAEGSGFVAVCAAFLLARFHRRSLGRARACRSSGQTSGVGRLLWYQ